MYDLQSCIFLAESDFISISVVSPHKCVCHLPYFRKKNVCASQNSRQRIDVSMPKFDPENLQLQQHPQAKTERNAVKCPMVVRFVFESKF